MLFFFLIAAIAAMVLSAPKAKAECRHSEKVGRYVYMRACEMDIAEKIEDPDTAMVPYSMTIFRNKRGWSFKVWMAGGRKKIHDKKSFGFRSLYGQKWHVAWTMKEDSDGRMVFYKNGNATKDYCLTAMLEQWGIDIDLLQMETVWNAWTEHLGNIPPYMFKKEVGSVLPGKDDVSNIRMPHSNSGITLVWAYEEMKRNNIDIDNERHVLYDADYDHERDLANDY